MSILKKYCGVLSRKYYCIDALVAAYPVPAESRSRAELILFISGQTLHPQQVNKELALHIINASGNIAWPELQSPPYRMVQVKFLREDRQGTTVCPKTKGTKYLLFMTNFKQLKSKFWVLLYSLLWHIYVLANKVHLK